MISRVRNQALIRALVLVSLSSPRELWLEVLDSSAAASAESQISL
jgi:hypothetical protein